MARRLAVYQGLIAAWRAKDVEGVLSRMTDDVVWHYAAGAAPPAVGKAKARKFVEGLAARVGEVRWRLFHAAEDGDRLFVEGVDEFFTKDGTRVAAPYAGVVEFRGDLICGLRDYVDVGVLEAMQAGGAAPAHIEALIAKEALPG